MVCPELDLILILTAHEVVDERVDGGVGIAHHVGDEGDARHHVALLDVNGDPA